MKIHSHKAGTVGVFLLILSCTGLSRVAGLPSEPQLPQSVDVHATPRPLFEPMYLYYGGKVGLSLLLAGTAMTAPDAGPTERAVVGGAAALIGIPSIAVIHQARRGNAGSVKRWRYTAFAIDLGLSAAIGAFGVHRIATGSVGDQYAGMGMLLVGVAGVSLSSLNLVPLLMERPALGTSD